MRSLVQASEAHLADCRYRQLSAKTLVNYELYEQSFLDWCSEHQVKPVLHSLAPEYVRRCAEWVRTRHGGKRGGQAAARMFVCVMKAWSHWLYDEGALEVDYLARLARPRVATVARQAYEAWEIQAIRAELLDGPTATRDVAILSLLLDTGLRIGELAALRLGDLDLKARRVKVVHGKGNRERVLGFGSADRDGGNTVRRLRAYLEQRVGGRYPSGPRDPLFLTHTGRPLTPLAFRKAFTRACKAAGVTHTEIHGLRHTFAIRFLLKPEHRADVEGLRYALGHLADDTYRVYAGQAGMILAEMAGGESIADQLLTDPGRKSLGGRTGLRLIPARDRQDGGPVEPPARKPSGAAASLPPRRRRPS